MERHCFIFSLSGGFFSILALRWFGFLVWVVLGFAGEDTVEATGVFSVSLRDW